MVLMIKSDKLAHNIEIKDRIIFRSKDQEIKNALRFLYQYLKVDSISEVVRRCILDEFNSLKVREEKRKELQEIANRYDLKVVDKYLR